MVTVPLGVGAYKRTFGGEPEVRLENRFLETNPTNLREHIALLTRAGTNELAAFPGAGANRGNYSKLGLFDGDIFVVTGENLYRYTSAGERIAITGIVNGTGHPEVTWMKGIGYEFLFIADGLLLQYYDGGSHATGILTLAGGGITNQVIDINGTYYSWNAAVDTGPPDGSSAHPWLANPGTDPLAAMANLLNFNGTRGVDFSTALAGPNQAVTASSINPSASGTLTLSSGTISNQVFNIANAWYSWSANVDANAPDGSSAHPWLALLGVDATASFQNMVKLINFTGTAGLDYSTALATASPYVSATSTPTTLVATAVNPGTAGNGIVTTVFSGTGLAWGAATLTGGEDSSATMTLSSIASDASGNAVTTSVFSGSFLSWSGATLAGGGIHSLSGVTVPPIALSDNSGATNNAAKALANVSSYVLVSVANTQAFYWLLPGETTIDPLNFAEKESNPDNIVDMLTVGDQVLITGEGSTENWYATGVFEAPFAPQEGRVYARGTIDGTAVVVSDSVILVGNDGIVYEVGESFGTTAQWGVHRISNHGVEERIRVQLRREQGLVP